MMHTIVLEGDCLHHMQCLQRMGVRFALTFLDPPFNQGKDYALCNDRLPAEQYWQWMRQVCRQAWALTQDGGAIYFMQREKNAAQVMSTLQATGWTLQNLIVWVKHTSATPSLVRFGKQYQILAYATKGAHARVFHRLRVDAPLRAHRRRPRDCGVFLTDVWDDIRELTSGYFAGKEALRDAHGARLHKQQTPLALVARTLLTSTLPGDWVLDPFAGSGTTAVAARQLCRHSVSIEIDPHNVLLIRQRLSECRAADDIAPLKTYYRFTPSLERIWKSCDDEAS